ncbi:hypothetical protein BCR34DRAFT_675805 [Clohesyomyces aquaticus]|uniref:Protein kinase domain-containing protein n=1 Tax=Clohesyomyces aquaticus TaxID=1231657 RepID=A0A1Y1Z3E5_9PLEO|nr:hypothetical protein BCR34DRAFT_675805 [Clohesyomyces aquaticus]
MTDAAPLDGKFVKYLTIQAGVYDVEDMCFEPALIAILLPLPPGDWNEGGIGKEITTGLPDFTKKVKSQLPDMMNLWHALQINHIELNMGAKLRSNVYEAMSVHFDETAVAKLLGHISEESRVIGFFIERVPNGRNAEPKDHALCHETQSPLHALGFKHEDINKHNFLIHHGKAILIDMESVTRCSDTEVLDQEFERLKEGPRDISGRSGRGVVTMVIK